MKGEFMGTKLTLDGEEVAVYAYHKEACQPKVEVFWKRVGDYVYYRHPTKRRIPNRYYRPRVPAGQE